MAAKPAPRTEPAPLNVKKLTREGSLSMNVADQLEGLITAGTIAVGEKLPTESGLCDSFGVSRTVIREAVAHLKSLGLVEARRGVGTTVIRAAPAEAMPASSSLQWVSTAGILSIMRTLRLSQHNASECWKRRTRCTATFP